MVQPKRKHKRNRRNSQPESIGKILMDEFPEFLPPHTRVVVYPERRIISIQNENGIPMEQVKALIHNLKKQNR